MKLVVLNPNTTQAMTDAVVQELLHRAHACMDVVGLTAAHGSAVIDSAATFAHGAESALAMASAIPTEADAVLLACFGDPGLAALRAAVQVPVVGLAEAAVYAAMADGRPFAIVTAGSGWVPLLHDCVASYHAARALVGVLALPGNGSQLKQNPDAFRAAVLQLSTQAADAGAAQLILGGAAFAGLTFEVDKRLTVIDVMAAAIAYIEAVLAGNAQHLREP